MLSIIKTLNLSILGVCAPELGKQGLTSWRGQSVLNEAVVLNGSNVNTVSLVNGVGHLPNEKNRERIFNNYKHRGYYFLSLIHPDAYVDQTVRLDEGIQIMAGAVIQADTFVGKNVIINTRASIDHDCLIEDYVHIAPGAVLCGNVIVKMRAFIGSGAIVIQGIEIGEEACIGAGTSIVRNVQARQRRI